MARIRRLIPSPAMAVALVALFMAMGGSAYALVVTSGSIKNNTIRSVDVRNGGLLGKDLRHDSVGGRAIKESSLGLVTASILTAQGTRALRGRERRRAAGPGARHHLVRAHGRGPLPGDLRPRRARLRLLRHRRRSNGGGSAARAAQITRELAGLERERRGRSHAGGDNPQPGRRPKPSRSTYSSSAEPPPPEEYSTRRSTFAGAPAAIENGGMSSVTTLLAPITQRSPTVTPLVITTFAPHQTLSPDARRALAGEPLPGDRLVRVVEAVVRVGHEAAVGEHAVIADLDEVLRRHHHGDVEEGPGADADPALVRDRQPHVRLEQRVLAHLEPAVAERLEHVAVDRPARECAPAGHSRWIAIRFHGSELRSYQRHFRHQIRAPFHRGSFPDGVS